MPQQEYQCTVVSVGNLTSTVFSVHFRTNPALTFLAGQFLSLKVPEAGPSGRDLRRAYSIGSPPEKDIIELCIKDVPNGPGTSFLRQLKSQSTFTAYGPAGHFVFKTPPTRHACFVATGTGVAPFRSIVQSESYAKNPPLSATCLFGTTHQTELLYQKDFEQAQSLKWIPCLSREKGNWSGFKGRVSEYLKTQFPESFDWKNTDFYLCGNGAMIAEVRQFLLQKGLDKKSILLEVYYQPKANQTDASP